MYTVYKITCSANGKYYIGQSANIKRRWSEHKIGLKYGAAPCGLMNADAKVYGSDIFVFEVLLEGLSKDMALAWERKLIWEGGWDVYNGVVPNPPLRERDALDLVRYIDRYNMMVAEGKTEMRSDRR